MIYHVHMLAFHDGILRPVEIPDNFPQDTNRLLESIFHYGQNDFQPVDGICSVSVGDVAEIEKRYYLCESFGWRELSQDEFDSYKSMDRDSRYRFSYGITPTS